MSGTERDEELWALARETAGKVEGDSVLDIDRIHAALQRAVAAERGNAARWLQDLAEEYQDKGWPGEAVALDYAAGAIREGSHGPAQGGSGDGT